MLRIYIINPVQTSAADISAESLKKRFESQIVFWGGGYDAQLINNGASYHEVYETVYNNIKVLAAGGNYIFAGVHNLPGNIPEHHLKGMLDAYRDARAYPEKPTGCQGCKMEITQRDVYTINGDIPKTRRYVEIIRQEIEDHWR